MSDSNPRKQILRDFMRAVWDEGNLEAAGRYIAPSYTIRHDPGDPWDGQNLNLAGYQERVRLSRAPFPDQRFEIIELFADDGGVMVTWRWQATHLGEMAGFPASGKVIQMTGATVYSFDAQDRLTGHWQIVDRLGVFQQLRRNAGA